MRRVLSQAVCLILPLVILTQLCSAGAVITVDDDGGADYLDIQQAVYNSYSGDTVLVYPGTYGPLNFYGMDILVRSLDPNDPAIVESTVIDPGMSKWAVVFEFGEGPDSVLHGFTLSGGGVRCYGSSPVIRKNVIENSPASAVWATLSAQPQILENHITNSAAEAIYNCNGTITGNTILNSDANGISYCDALIQDNTVTGCAGSGIRHCLGVIKGNTVTQNQTGIFFCAGSIIQNTVADNNDVGIYLSENITSNTVSGNGGGGLYYCSGGIYGNLVYGNSGRGGMSECFDPIENNVIAGNTADYGAGLYNCTSGITNNTIVHNIAAVSGGGLYNCPQVVSHNIIAYNQAPDTGGLYGTAQTSFNCWWANVGGTFGGGAVSGPHALVKNPAFASAGNWTGDQYTPGDYHLLSKSGRYDPDQQQWFYDSIDSPCIDAGDPNSTIGDEPYPNGDIPNLGAYGRTEQASKSSAGQQIVCTEQIKQDLDGDCKVDYRDTAIFAAHWRQTLPLDPNAMTLLWQQSDDFAAENELANTACGDTAGNIYIFGTTAGDGGFMDAAAVKFTSVGDRAWKNTYSGQGGKSDVISASACSDSFLYAVGKTWNTDGNYDMLTLKFDQATGDVNWARLYDNPDVNAADEALACALDSAGNIYITGKSASATGGLDCVTIKYDSLGDTVWTKTYSGPPGNDDVGSVILLDGENLYVGGYSVSAIDGKDFLLIKYDTDGQLKWSQTYNGTGNGEDFIEALAVDPNGIVYAAGTSRGDSNKDVVTARYDPLDGDIEWLARFAQAGGFDETAVDIELDPAGGVYTAANAMGTTGRDYLAVKYNSAGLQQWAARYDGPFSGVDNLADIALTPAGRIIMAGYSQSSGGNYDMALVKFDTTGQFVDAFRYDGPGGGTDSAIWVRPDADQAFMAGYVYSAAGDYDLAAVKVSQSYSCLQTITGDWNTDCTVDISDLAAISAKWLTCNLNPSDACWE